MLKLHNPQLGFLMEPKLDSVRIKKVSLRYGFQCGIGIDANGNIKGLCVAWKSVYFLTKMLFKVY